MSASPEASQAVFLSYASQDAEAVKRICEALRAAGVEVWFDQNELVGGDAWDAKIRGQISSCALFVPVISAGTQARLEGYFRIEWKLAAQRTHAMADEKTFLLPVVIDATRDSEAKVPAEFRAVQWTKLPAAADPSAFAQRVKKLLARESGERDAISSGSVTYPSSTAVRGGRRNSRRVLAAALAGVIVVAGVIGVVTSKRKSDATSLPAGKSIEPVAVSSPPMSEARKLVVRARDLFESLDGTRDDFKLAEEYLAQASAKDSTDAEVWAAVAQLNSKYMVRGWDQSDQRREEARVAAQRALRLDPQSFEARFTWIPSPSSLPEELAEGERVLRALHQERPTDRRVLRALATTVQQLNRRDEANALRDEAAALPGSDALALYDKARSLWGASRQPEAEVALAASIRVQPFSTSLLLQVWFLLDNHGDLEQAKTTLDRIAPSALLEDRGCFFAYTLHMFRREPDAALTRLRAMPRDWINDNWYRGPKGMLAGDAQALAGRTDAAALEWRSALKLVDARLAATPSDVSALYNRCNLLARLGEQEEANRVFRLVEQMKVDWRKITSRSEYAATLVKLGRRTEALAVIAQQLEQGGSVGQFPAAELKLSPAWDAVRDDPEFVRLVALAEKKDQPAGGSPAPDVPGHSVAVLAFANLSDDKANEYFSDGISEELLNVLAKIPDLKVSARTSAFYFKGKEVPIPEIARKLSVAYVVEGSVRKAGDKVRITAQLIKAIDGFHVWSDTFTRDLKDVFAVQDEIAGLIAQNLSLKMGMTSAVSRREVNPAAYQLVLEGRHFWNLRNADGFARGEEAFRKSIDLDPRFASAHAGLADVIVTRAIFQSYGGLNQIDMSVGRQEALRALELDPSLAEVYPSLGATLMWDGRIAEAEQTFKKSVTLNPNYALAHHWYAIFLEHQGRLDEALVEIDRAIELDPLAITAHSTRERLLLSAGNYAEAEATAERVRVLRPEFALNRGERALGLMAMKRPDEALAVARTIAGDADMTLRWKNDAEAIFVLRQTGHEKEAAAHLAVILNRLPPESYLRGLALSAMGRWDEALPFLQQMPAGLQSLLFWSPIWDAHRQDARFQQLLVKLGGVKAYEVARATQSRLIQQRSAKK